MKRAMILLASMLLAFAAAAQDRPSLPVLSICQDGKLIAIQLIAPVPDVYTIPIPPDVCTPHKPDVAHLNLSPRRH